MGKHKKKTELAIFYGYRQYCYLFLQDSFDKEKERGEGEGGAVQRGERKRRKKKESLYPTLTHRFIPAFFPTVVLVSVTSQTTSKPIGVKY